MYQMHLIISNWFDGGKDIVKIVQDLDRLRDACMKVDNSCVEEK